MAVNRVLTSDEKLKLQVFQRFQDLCRQAIFDKAIYWVGLDGTALPGGQTAANLARWAKSKLRGQAIVKDSNQIGSNYVQQFIIFLKNINLWDTAVGGNVVDNTVVCDFMVTSSTFDTLADAWMDENIRGVDFN